MQFLLAYRPGGASDMVVEQTGDAVETARRLCALRVRAVTPSRQTLNIYLCEQAVEFARRDGTYVVLQPDCLFGVQIVGLLL